jgi:hypothetical protein
MSVTLQESVTYYPIYFPNVAGGTTTNFSFFVTLPDGAWNFQFNFYQPDVNIPLSSQSYWTGYATLPTGQIRVFSVFPNVVNWSLDDYVLLIFTSNLTTIGLTDLANVNMYVAYA